MTAGPITTRQAASRLGLSIRRVQDMLRTGQIVGAVLVGVRPRTTWQIPVDEDGQPVTRDWTRGRPGRRPVTKRLPAPR